VITAILRIVDWQGGGRVHVPLAAKALACMGSVSTQDTSAQKGRLLVFTHSSGPCTPSQRAVHGYRSTPDAAIMPR